MHPSLMFSGKTPALRNYNLHNEMFFPLNKLCWHVGREIGTGSKLKSIAVARLEVSHAIVACGHMAQFGRTRGMRIANPCQGPWPCTKILGPRLGVVGVV